MFSGQYANPVIFKKAMLTFIATSEIVSNLDHAVHNLSSKMSLTLSFQDPHMVGLHDVLDLDWRAVESICVAPVSTGNLQGPDIKATKTHQADAPLSTTKKTLRMSDLETSSYDHDAFKSTVLQGIDSSHPAAWELFDRWCPYRSSMVMNIAHFNASISSSLRINDEFRLCDQQYDDDVCLKAAILGWAAVKKGMLDPVWILLKEMDFALLNSQCGKVERIVLLRILHAVLVDLACPSSRLKRFRLPRYMMSTDLHQTAPSNPLISMLIWPSLRDLLTARKITTLPAHFLMRYLQSLRFSWLFDVRDMYSVNKQTGRYAFTDDFDRRYHDLRSWSLHQKEGLPTSQLRRGSKRPSLTPPKEARSVRAKTGDPSSQGEKSGSDTHWVARAWSDLGIATETMFKEGTVKAGTRDSDSTNKESSALKPEWFAPYAVEILSAMATDQVSLSRLRL